MKIGFFGFGNMARATAAGLELAGVSRGDMIACAHSESTRAYALENGYGYAESFGELAAVSDIIFILVKPRIFRELAPEISASGFRGRLLSFMAVTTITEIKSVLDVPAARVIPTLAMEKGIGYSGFAFAPGEEPLFEDIKTLFSVSSTVKTVDETQLDLLTEVTSCGLGYAAYIMDTYAKAAEKLGFTHDEASRMTASAFAGAAAMAPFDALYKKVATKGGMTEKGIAKLEAAGLESLLEKLFEI